MVVSEGRSRHRRAEHDIDIPEQVEPWAAQRRPHSTRPDPFGVVRGYAAQPIGGETLVFRRQGLGGTLEPRAVLRRQIHAVGRRHKLEIDLCRTRKIGQFRALAQDSAAAFAETVGEPVKSLCDTGGGWAEWVLVEDQHSEVWQLVVSRWGQRQLVADPLR